jgi:hypothetical protein
MFILYQPILGFIFTFLRFEHFPYLAFNISPKASRFSAVPSLEKNSKLEGKKSFKNEK